VRIRRAGDPRALRRRGDSLTAVIALALALPPALTACSGESEARRRVVTRITPPAGIRESLAETCEQPEIRFRFHEEDAEGWRAVAGGPARLTGGALEFDAADEPPVLELEKRISLLDHDQVEVRMRVDEGEKATLQWAVDGGGFGRARQRHVTLVPGQTKTYSFPLDGPERGELELRALRLQPSDRPTAVRIAGIGLPLRPPEKRRALRSSPLVRVGRSFRPARVFRGELSWSIPIDDLQGTRIRLPFGAPEASRGVEYRLDAGTADRPGAFGVFRTTCPAGAWSDRVVDLGEIRRRGAERITLRARALAEDGAVLVAPAEVLAPDDEPLPNLLLIVVDTLRADRLTPYGCAEETSPRIGRLADEGVVFARATAQCSWTIPSVASLLTGRYPARIGVQWGRELEIDPAFPLVPEQLASAGYDTACIFGNGIVDANWGFARGFDHFVLGRALELTAERITDHAIEWLERHGRDRFFLYVHYIDPHDGYEPPHRNNPFIRKGEGVPNQRIHELFLGREQADEEELARIRRAYDAEVFFADREIGRLLDHLRRAGLDRHTAIVLTSDHGEEIADHGGFRHGLSQYVEQTRVPLILRLPDREHAGIVVRDPVELIDVAPTLRELAGLDAAGSPGHSLLRTLRAEGKERAIFSETLANGPRRQSVEEGRFKLILFDRDGPGQRPDDPLFRRIARDYEPVELYEVATDPSERDNVAARHPEVVSRLSTRMERHRERVDVEGAPGPAKAMDPETAARLRALGYLPPDPPDDSAEDRTP